jgi:transcriptional regulator with XRE-family HTH domain
MSWTRQHLASTVVRAVALEREEFARRLVALREQHDPPLTQEQAAALIDVHPRQYHRWENAESTPYLSSIKKIADAYGIDQNHLIVSPEELGLAGGPPATREDLARLERKLDLILAALGAAPDAPAADQPNGAQPPAPPAALRPQGKAPAPSRAKTAPPRSTRATSRQQRAQ